MTNYEGVVRSTLERSYRGKKLYSFFLADVDGLFKLGEKRPTFKEGAYVKFQTNDKLEVIGDIEATSREPVTSQAQPVAKAAQAERVEKASTAYEDKEAKRQKSIHYQSARNSAIEVIRLAFEQGAIALPSKKGAGYDALLGFVDHLTNRYFTDNENTGHVEISMPSENDSTSSDKGNDDE